jgi:hypothetical protein
MTLLVRAPREVYRVYSEEEFFAMHEQDLFDGETRVGPLRPAVSSGVAERRLRRLAGVAALVGEVGATFAVTGPWPVTEAGRHALADSRSATTPMPVATRASVSSVTRVDVAVSSVRRSLAITRSWRPRGEHHPGIWRSDGARRLWQHEVARRYAVLTPRTASAPVLARPSAAPIDVATVIASATASEAVTTTPQPQHAEFGFER